MTSGQERRPLGAALPITAGENPVLLVAAQDAVPALELDHVQPPAAQDQGVDLIPAAVIVHELEVGPRTVRRSARDDLTQQAQTLGFVGERRRGHLDPPVVRHSSPTYYVPSQLQVPRLSIRRRYRAGSVGRRNRRSPRNTRATMSDMTDSTWTAGRGMERIVAYEPSLSDMLQLLSDRSHLRL